MIKSAHSVVQQWHAALNTANVDKMVELVHPHVEVGGPRGSAHSVQVMREWIGRANLRLVPLRWFAQGNDVVVEELGEWFAPDTGLVTSSRVVASVFRVDDDGLITRIIRHEALAVALEDACLMLEDEIKVN